MIGTSGSNQRFRIRGRFETGAQHGIVAGSLLFVTQTAGDGPGEWMKPVERAREMRDQARPEIFAVQVSPLMFQGGSAPVEGPRFRRTAASESLASAVPQP